MPFTEQPPQSHAATGEIHDHDFWKMGLVVPTLSPFHSPRSVLNRRSAQVFLNPQVALEVHFWHHLNSVMSLSKSGGSPIYRRQPICQHKMLCFIVLAIVSITKGKDSTKTKTIRRKFIINRFTHGPFHKPTQPASSPQMTAGTTNGQADRQHTTEKNEAQDASETGCRYPSEPRRGPAATAQGLPSKSIHRSSQSNLVLPTRFDRITKAATIDLKPVGCPEAIDK